MIKKNIIKEAPVPVGNYPHSVEINGMLYLSGVGPRNTNDSSIPGNEYDDDGNLLGYDIEQQTHAVMHNIKIILEESNSSWNNLIDVTVFLTDIAFFPQMNEVFNDYFPNDPPARSAVQVSALPMNARIAIEAVGFIQ